MAKRWLLAKKWTILVVMLGLVLGLFAGSYLPNMKLGALDPATQTAMLAASRLQCNTPQALASSIDPIVNNAIDVGVSRQNQSIVAGAATDLAGMTLPEATAASATEPTTDQTTSGLISKVHALGNTDAPYLTQTNNADGTVDITIARGINQGDLKNMIIAAVVNSLSQSVSTCSLVTGSVVVSVAEITVSKKRVSGDIAKVLGGIINKATGNVVDANKINVYTNTLGAAIKIEFKNFAYSGVQVTNGTCGAIQNRAITINPAVKYYVALLDPVKLFQQITDPAGSLNIGGEKNANNPLSLYPYTPGQPTSAVPVGNVDLNAIIAPKTVETLTYASPWVIPIKVGDNYASDPSYVVRNCCGVGKCGATTTVATNPTDSTTCQQDTTEFPAQINKAVTDTKTAVDGAIAGTPPSITEFYPGKTAKSLNKGVTMLSDYLSSYVARTAVAPPAFQIDKTTGALIKNNGIGPVDVWQRYANNYSSMLSAGLNTILLSGQVDSFGDPSVTDPTVNETYFPTAFGKANQLFQAFKMKYNYKSDDYIASNTFVNPASVSKQLSAKLMPGTYPAATSTSKPKANLIVTAPTVTWSVVSQFSTYQNANIYLKGSYNNCKDSTGAGYNLGKIAAQFGAPLKVTITVNITNAPYLKTSDNYASYIAASTSATSQITWSKWLGSPTLGNYTFKNFKDKPGEMYYSSGIDLLTQWQALPPNTTPLPPNTGGGTTTPGIVIPGLNFSGTVPLPTPTKTTTTSGTYCQCIGGKNIASSGSPACGATIPTTQTCRACNGLYTQVNGVWQTGSSSITCVPKAVTGTNM